MIMSVTKMTHNRKSGDDLGLEHGSVQHFRGSLHSARLELSQILDLAYEVPWIDDACPLLVQLLVVELQPSSRAFLIPVLEQDVGNTVSEISVDMNGRDAPSYPREREYCLCIDGYDVIVADVERQDRRNGWMSYEPWLRYVGQGHSVLHGEKAEPRDWRSLKCGQRHLG
jgi:hypothetical protein